MALTEGFYNDPFNIYSISSMRPTYLTGKTWIITTTLIFAKVNKNSIRDYPYGFQFFKLAAAQYLIFCLHQPQILAIIIYQFKTTTSKLILRKNRNHKKFDRFKEKLRTLINILNFLKTQCEPERYYYHLNLQDKLQADLIVYTLSIYTEEI